MRGRENERGRQRTGGGRGESVGGYRVCASILSYFNKCDQVAAIWNQYADQLRSVCTFPGNLLVFILIHNTWLIDTKGLLE